MADRRITKRVVDGLKPRPKEFTLWDAKMPGFGVRCGVSYSSLVEFRCLLLMYSRTAESAYRRDRPIFTVLCPDPVSMAFANQDRLILRSLATSAGWSSGSIAPVFAAFMPITSFLSAWRWMDDARAACAKRVFVSAKLFWSRNEI